METIDNKKVPEQTEVNREGWHSEPEWDTPEQKRWNNYWGDPYYNEEDVPYIPEPGIGKEIPF